MIAEIRDAIVALLNDLRSGPLCDIPLIKAGGEAPDLALQPAITVDWGGLADMKIVGSRVEFRLDFNLVLYSTGSSLLSLEEGSSEHLRLICRPDGGKLIGLLPAALRLTGGLQLEDGTNFLVTMDEEIKSYGAKSSAGWSFMSEQRAVFQTWFNPSQIIS